MNRTFIGIIVTIFLLAALLLPGRICAQCAPASNLTALYSVQDAAIRLHFVVPEAGLYRIWSTTDATHAAAFPDEWTLENTMENPAGTVQWADANLAVNYKRYTVTHLCGETESLPCNQAGYVKIPITETIGVTYTPFGLPFKFWYVSADTVPTYGTENRKPSSIIGPQTSCGTLWGATRIVRQDNGQFGYRNIASSCRWAGTLETNPANMEPGRAYWYANWPTMDLDAFYLAGEVDTTGVGIPSVTIAAPAAPGGALPTPYSWRYPFTRAPGQLGLLSQGFAGGTLASSDRVLAQIGGASFYYRAADSTWQGSLTAVLPGRACWIQNKHFSHAWSYTYNPSTAR